MKVTFLCKNEVKTQSLPYLTWKVDFNWCKVVTLQSNVCNIADNMAKIIVQNTQR